MIAAKRLAILVGLAALLAALPRPAAAQRDAGDIESYRVLVARAAEQFRKEQFSAARESFLAAYDIHPEPVLLYNVAGTFRREGKLREAIEYYQRFLDRAPRDHERRVKARAYIDELQESLAGGELRAPDGDDDLEYDSRDIVFGDTDPPSDRAEPRQRADTEPPPGRAGRRGRLLGISLGAAGGVLLAVALQQQLSARSTISDISDLPEGTPWDEGLDNRYADSQSAERRAKVLAVVGVGAVAAGAIVYYLGERKRRAARGQRADRGDAAQSRRGNRRVSVLPDAHPGGLGLQFRAEF